MSGFGEMVSPRFRPAASALSAISGLVEVRLPNYKFGLTLPVAWDDDQSQLDPKRALLRH